MGAPHSGHAASAGSPFRSYPHDWHDPFGYPRSRRAQSAIPTSPTAAPASGTAPTSSTQLPRARENARTSIGCPRHAGIPAPPSTRNVPCRSDTVIHDQTGVLRFRNDPPASSTQTAAIPHAVRTTARLNRDRIIPAYLPTLRLRAFLFIGFPRPPFSSRSNPRTCQTLPLHSPRMTRRVPLPILSPDSAPKEKCGVFGIWGHQDGVRKTYLDRKSVV